MTTTTHSAKTLKLIWVFLVGLLLITWAGLPGALYSAPAATTWYVGTGGSDSNTCTSPALPCKHIQVAIDKAASGDTIIIAAGIYPEQLSIEDKNLTLNGQGAASTILDGNQVDTVLAIIRSSVPSVSVNVSGVTLQNGRAGQPGGGLAIEAKCFLTLSNSVIASNTASSGGGIFNQGTLKLINVTVRANSATEALSQGGGIYNTGSLELSNVLVTDNHAPSGSGGGITNQNTITVTGSSINSNTSSGWGGGIYNETGTSKLILLNSTIQGNTAASAGGGLFNAGSAQIDTAVIMGNQANGGVGGGIDNMGALILTRSALVYNAATTQGGGLSNGSSAQLTNVTVSDNTALAGGGIQNSGGTLSLQFDTVSNNSSPSLNNTSGSVTAGNSIFDQATGNACNAAISSAGYNIDRGASCGFLSSGDYSNIDPLLGPLQDNGGNSPTRAPAFSSAAVDTAGACPPPATDQRGIARPQPQSPPGTCDRGAYEVVEYGNSSALDIGPNQCMPPIYFTVSEKFYIGRLQVGVNLTYPNRHDLTIRLFSPASSQVVLLGPAANIGQNLDTLFDDSAPTIVPPGDQITGVPFYTPSYKPSTPLAQMRGININGTWTLQICNAGTGVGTLNRWVLVVPEFASSLKVYLPLIRR